MRKFSLAGAAALALTSIAVGLMCSSLAAMGATCTPAPVATTRPLPPYPAVSLQLGESGTVHLQITVARNGHVSGTKVTHSSGYPRLDEAAASYVRKNYLWYPIACASAKTDVNVVFDPAAGCRFTKEGCAWRPN